MTHPTAGTIEAPVLIVGAGPVGLALAAELGWRGTRCLLVEQSDGVIHHPRATAINARSMEFLRRWGVAEKVRDAAAPEGFPHTALYVTSLTGFEIARIERPHHGGRQPGATSPERAQRCNQLWLDPILRDLVQSLPGVTLRYQWRFEALVEESDRVIATIHDLVQDRRQRIAARYVVDCSGGHSPIRRSLGISLQGQPSVDYNLSVFVRAPELWAHHDKGQAALVFFVDGLGIWRNLVLIDGRELYRFGVSGKAFYDDPDKVDVAALFTAAVGRSVPHEFLSVRRWTARDAVADRYRVGRVFLAGDAAHLNNPSGGLGLNTGLGDANNLSWKLDAMVNGWGGAALLDSYESERRPIGLRNIGHAAHSHANDRDRSSHPAIAADSAEGERARRAMGDAIRATQTQMFITDGTALGYRYEPSPICWADGTPAPPDTISEYHPSARPGARAPHAWLDDGRSTLDLFGRGFVLLRLGREAPDPSSLAAGFAQRGVPLALVDGADPRLHALYERKLVLVRPDGHVAWRGDAAPADPLALVDRLRGAS